MMMGEETVITPLRDNDKWNTVVTLSKDIGNSVKKFELALKDTFLRGF